jgi:hypothetical protein
MQRVEVYLFKVFRLVFLGNIFNNVPNYNHHCNTFGLFTFRNSLLCMSVRIIIANED